MKNKDLKALTNRLQMENEQLRDKLEQCSRDYHFQVIGLSRIINLFLPFTMPFIR